jgi:Zn-dependent membrane protease YugP
MFFPFDPLYLIMVLPAVLLGLYAQFKVQTAYNKYLKVANASQLNGLDAARRLLGAAGLGHVTIEGTPGKLSDHYDPQSKTLRLSDGVARSASVASVAIVAHEVGHAIQDNQGYAPLRLRSFIVPGVKIGAALGPILFFIGFLFQMQPLALLGLVLYSTMGLFALVTLPTELNASSRAMALLTSSGMIVGREEEKGARSVLNAAALTYVAFVAQVLMQLLYYVLLLSGGRNRD